MKLCGCGCSHSLIDDYIGSEDYGID
jgi:hypothetical protein